MTAEEIRATKALTLRSEADAMLAIRAVLLEIAAQLAELNEKLDRK
jgi:hypothetical protein